MKLFLQRLRHCVVTLLIGIAIFAFAWLLNTTDWILYPLAALALLIIVGAVVYYIWTFIHWLFIEPFRSASGSQRKGGDRT